MLEIQDFKIKDLPKGIEYNKEKREMIFKDTDGKVVCTGTIEDDNKQVNSMLNIGVDFCILLRMRSSDFEETDDNPTLPCDFTCDSEEDIDFMEHCVACSKRMREVYLKAEKEE